MADVTIRSLLQPVAQKIPGAPDATLIECYRTAAREFCTQTRWVTRAVTGDTIAGTKQYSLGSDDTLEVIGIRAITVAGLQPLRAGDPTGWPYPDAEGAPGQFAYVPEGQFVLYPTPNSVRSMLVTVECTPALNTPTLPDDLTTRWHERLTDGALWKAYTVPGNWANPGLAKVHEVAFKAGINNARADVQRAHNPGSVGVARRVLFPARR